MITATKTVEERILEIFVKHGVKITTLDLHIAELGTTIKTRRHIVTDLLNEFRSYPHHIELKKHGTLRSLIDHMKYHELLYIITKGHK